MSRSSCAPKVSTTTFSPKGLQVVEKVSGVRTGTQMLWDEPLMDSIRAMKPLISISTHDICAAATAKRKQPFSFKSRPQCSYEAGKCKLASFLFYSTSGRDWWTWMVHVAKGRPITHACAAFRISEKFWAHPRRLGDRVYTLGTRSHTLFFISGKNNAS